MRSFVILPRTFLRMGLTAARVALAANVAAVRPFGQIVPPREVCSVFGFRGSGFARSRGLRPFRSEGYLVGGSEGRRHAYNPQLRPRRCGDHAVVGHGDRKLAPLNRILNTHRGI